MLNVPKAYEARDEAQNKASALREKSDKEMAQYTMEIKELTRVLEHDKKLKSFMGVKGQDRSKVLTDSLLTVIVHSDTCCFRMHHCT